MIRYLEQEEKGRTRELWEEAFPEDSVSFADYYYKEKMEGYITTGPNFMTQGGFTVSEADMIFFYNNIIPKLSAYSNILTKDIDLSKYEKKKVTRYTSEITNCKECEGTVYANLLVYRGKVIGCDYSAANPEGFVKPLTDFSEKSEL